MSIVDRLQTNLQSGRVLLTLLLIAAAAAVAALLARRFTHRRGVILLAAALPVAVATTVLAAPYFSARELHEALPTPVAMTPAPAVTSARPAAAPTSPQAAADSGPGRLTGARLRGLGGHRASGDVELHRLADGTILLRFTDVDIEGTPTPRVYLVPGRDRERPGGTALGTLRAERGSFNYRLAARPDEPVTVLVWCERFAVPIAGATFD